MKSLKTTISITELQKTIKIWRSRKITDSTIPKLLDLYLGLTAYMNDKHIYPVENFYDIKMSLRFSTTQSLIEAVKASQSFKFIVNEGQKQIKAFYSPLCHEENSKLETKEDSKTSQSSLNLPQAFAQTLAVDNIYNIYTKGNSSDEELSPKSEATLEDKSSKKDIITEESLAAAKEFFHLINGNSTQKAQVLTPLINRFQMHEGQARFMKSNHTGRLCWLSNLLKSAHGQYLLNDAARGSRQKREQVALETKKNQRDNHPVNEFEWTDPETGMRFYDDKDEGAVNIPADAEARPSGNAVWNVLSKEWILPIA